MKRVLLSVTLLASLASAEKITIGLGYIPNVQFTPFYIADALKYYQQAGFEVEFQHGYVSELMPLLLQGKLDAVVGDAEDAIFAKNQGADVKYVMAMYQRPPVTVFSLADKNISKPSDLKGKTLGIPGAFGSSYIALQALLKQNKLKENDLKIVPIGFTQLEAVSTGKVDAALGYINNEPLILQASGQKVNTLDLSKAYPMVGVGLITSEKWLKNVPKLKKLVNASQKGLEYTIKNPEPAFKTAQKYFGTGGGTLEVLKASVLLMQSSYTAKNSVGYSDPSAWASALLFLKSSGQVKNTAKAGDFYSNAYLSKFK